MRWLAFAFVIFACTRERTSSLEVTKVKGVPIEEKAAPKREMAADSSGASPRSSGSTLVAIAPSSVPRTTGALLSLDRVSYEHCSPFERTAVKITFGESGSVESVTVDTNEPARSCLEKAFKRALPIAPCSACGTLSVPKWIGKK